LGAFAAARQAQIAAARSRALAGGGAGGSGGAGKGGQAAAGGAAAAAGAAGGATGKARKGCWLDSMKAKAAAKRKAAVLGQVAGASKRQAAAGGPTAAAREAGSDADARAAGAGGGEEGTQPGPLCGGAGVHAVLYAYNEGYTNAVKRPIKMAELLPLDV
jgi:hypothetical protein